MKPSSNQLTLSYEAPFDERMASFRAQLDVIDPADLDLTPTQWDRVCTLLRAVFAFACGEWGRYAQVEPERLQESAELSRRQVSEARCLARDAGLLESERHYPRRHEHRRADKLWVVRERFDELVSKARVRNRAQPCFNRAQPGAHKETLRLPISQSLLGRLGATRKITTEAAVAARRFLDNGADVPVNAELALEFGQKIGRSPLQADRELAWKLAAIASVLGEAWLWSIAGGVRETSPRNVWALVRSIAENGTYEAPGPGKKILNALLARTPPPPEGWPRAHAGPDLSQRLCVADPSV